MCQWRWPEQYHHHRPHGCQPEPFQTLLRLNAISEFLNAATWTRYKAVKHGRNRVCKCICGWTEKASLTDVLIFNGIQVGRTVSKNGAAYELSLFQSWSHWPKALRISFRRRVSCPVIYKMPPVLGPWWKPCHVRTWSRWGSMETQKSRSCRTTHHAMERKRRYSPAASVTLVAEFSHPTIRLYYTQTPGPESPGR